MAKGSYLGGSSIIHTGNVGGPSRRVLSLESTKLALPRAGGAEVIVPKTSRPKHPRVALPTFRKLRRRFKDAAEFAPFLPEHMADLVKRLSEIHDRMEALAKQTFTPEIAEEAAGLSKEFYARMGPLIASPAIIARAKLKMRDDARAQKAGPPKEDDLPIQGGP